MPNFLKDPDSVLDYAWDWASLDWLESGETIAAYTVTVPSELTLVSSTEVDGIVTAWLSGGTSRTNYICTCQITTSLGRTDERSLFIRVEDR